MTRIVTEQAAHTYGVLDPLMIERRDTKFVAGGLADAENIIVLPQGGYYDRGGTTRHQVLRRSLEAVTITAGMLDGPNGGTEANLLVDDAGDVFTTGDVTGDPFVLVDIDFGAPQEITLFDVRGFHAEDNAEDALALQYHDGAAWQDFGGAFDIPVLGDNDEPRNRRFARAPETGGVTAQEWRLVVTGGAGPGEVTVGHIRAWAETGTLSDAFVRHYNRDTGQRYGLVLSHRNIDVFAGGAWQAAAELNLPDGEDPGRVKHEPSYDTILLFHQQMPPQRLQRQGADDEWHCAPAIFRNIPLVDYGGEYTNGVDERQEVRCFDINSGNSFELQLEGETTEAIVRSSDAATTAASIKSALEDLPNVQPGLSVLGITNTRFRIDFTGGGAAPGGNEARDWLEMTGRALDDTNGVVTVSTRRKGEHGGEDVMSASAGWPAVGRFIQERLVLAGFASRPATYLMSVPGEPFNLDVERAGAAAAIMIDIADDEEPTIRDIVSSRGLLFFTDARPWRLANTTLSAEDAPQLIPADAPGIDPAARPVASDNGVYYVQRGGQALRLLSYTELEQNFIADNASVISASLVDGPADLVRRRAVAGNDADLILFVNADGRLVTLTTMRTQDVSGFAPHRTDQGAFRSVTVTGDETVWLVAERQVAGETRMVLESMDPAGVLDSAVSFEFDPAQATLTGLEAYEGQTLQVMAGSTGGGAYAGTFTVDGGEIALPEAVEAATVGYWRAPFATDAPFHMTDPTQPSRPAARLKRVVACTVSLMDTTSVAIAANGAAAYDAALARFDDTALDDPVPPWTGRLRLEGFRGWTETAQLTVTQVTPGKLTVRSVQKEIAA